MTSPEEARGEHEVGHCWCGAYHNKGTSPAEPLDLREIDRRLETIAYLKGGAIEDLVALLAELRAARALLDEPAYWWHTLPLYWQEKRRAVLARVRDE
jgi:hypothetical protein